MLFVDNILSLEPGVSATGEWQPSRICWLRSHPNSTNLLLTLPMEALAQLGACAVFAIERYRGRKPFLVGLEKVEFLQPYSVDSTVYLSVEIISLGSRYGKARGTAKVGKQTICRGEISFVVV
ncbi:hypothetical protein [Rheinheimera sp. NSM]|uniref:hypothetical protein n=1 Tax=Rheinheimera sp. NSM TaxID=3457884 RepID=UPI004035A726